MDSFDQEMEEEEPLDLSMKTRSRSSSPSRTQDTRRGNGHTEDTPLCLIKDCGCHHQPRDVPYTEQEYVAAVSSVGSVRGFERLNGRSFSQEIDSDMCQQRHWERPPFIREELDRHGSGHQSVDVNSSRLGPGSGYYDSNDHKPHYLIDLRNVNATKEADWRTSGNNESTARHFANDCGSLWRRPNPDLSSSSRNSSLTHWRPFADVTDRSGTDDRSIGNSSMSDIRRSAADVVAIAEVDRSLPKGFPPTRGVSSSTSVTPGGHNSVIQPRGAMFSPEVCSSLSAPGDSASSPSLPTFGASIPRNPSSSSSSQRTTCHSFASTVPLISNSSSGTTPSSKSLTLVRTTNPAIRVTRSPKAFHNEVVRADAAEVRGCPFLRPQDSRRLPVGRISVKEKENIDLLEQQLHEGVKMPALDYLISKVLVERVDIPFKPCNTEIKKIYNGERKGRLRLVDLIELQVEESLKA